MPALTMQDVGDLMRRLNETYQPVGGGCVATPAKLQVLVDRLAAYTDEVQAARNKHRLLGVASVTGIPGMVASELLGGGDVDVAQWRNDMAAWQYRIAEYQRHLDAVPSSLRDTVEGCAAIYPGVTAPLLDGIWYQVLPGILLNDAERARMQSDTGHPDVDVTTPDHPGGHSNAKVPDAMSPFSLGNQIIVYQDFQKENAQRLVHDVIDSFESVFDPLRWPWWLQAAAVVGAGAVVGMGSLYIYRAVAPKRRRNPKRVRSAKGSR